MKKTDFILIGLVIIIAIVGIFSTKGTKAEAAIEFPLKLAGEVGLHEIDYSEYEKMVNNGPNTSVTNKKQKLSSCFLS